MYIRTVVRWLECGARNRRAPLPPAGFLQLCIVLEVDFSLLRQIHHLRLNLHFTLGNSFNPRDSKLSLVSVMF